MVPSHLTQKLKPWKPLRTPVEPRAHLHLEHRLLAADDVVNDAVLLGLDGAHVPVAVRVGLDLGQRLACDDSRLL